MRMQLLSILVWTFPPSFCPWPLRGDISVAVLGWFFSCRLLRSSAIRFKTNSRSWKTTHIRCSVLWLQIRPCAKKANVILCAISVSTATLTELAPFVTRSLAPLTCFFCFLSALASWATRCLCCSSKPLLSCLMRDSIGRGSGDRLHDCDGLNTNEGDAFEIKTIYTLNLETWNFALLIYYMITKK